VLSQFFEPACARTRQIKLFERGKEEQQAEIRARAKQIELFERAGRSVKTLRTERCDVAGEVKLCFDRESAFKQIRRSSKLERRVDKV